MLLVLAAVAVVALLVVALIPTKKSNSQSHGVVDHFRSAPPLNLRRQQLNEESDAIASEYQLRAEERWRAEIVAKASELLAPKSAVD